MSRTSSCQMLLLLLQLASSHAFVHQVSTNQLEEFRKGKLMVVIFLDTPTCTRCRLQYPFFVAASQAFPSDPQIFFVRVRDARLAKNWGAEELPALFYFRNGIEEPESFNVEVTVDDIIDGIARRLHGNFGGLERFYAVEVTSSNFHEVVKTPQQSVLLLAYDKNSMEEVNIMEQVAKAFRNDDAIVICKLNVDKETALRDQEFKSRDVPAVFWYSAQDKPSPKRFGGHISVSMQTTFINEQTGLNRNPDGSLKPESGRIPQLDDIVLEMADDILAGNKKAFVELAGRLQEIKEQLPRHQLEYGDYYGSVMDKAQAEGTLDVVNTEWDDIGIKLDQHQDLLPKEEERLKRRRHILTFLRNLPAESRHRKRQQLARRHKEEQERREQEREEEERRREEETEERERMANQPIKTRVVPREKGSFTAEATIHRRTHEDL